MKIFNGICLIVGAFLGAGFVSGREVASYFSRFGSISNVAIIFTSLLFSLIIFFFLSISSKVHSFDEFSKKYFGKTSELVNWLFAFSLMILVSSMFAGASSLAKNLGVSSILFLCVTFILCFFIIKKELGFLTKLNMLLVPLFIFILLSIADCKIIAISNFSSIAKAISSGVSYVFINIVTLGFFVLEIGSNYTKKQKIWISIGCGVLIGVLLFIVNNTILTGSVVEESMPNLNLAKKHNLLLIVFEICIYLAILSTLITNAYVLIKFINKYIKNLTLSVLLILTTGLTISILGFEVIVGYIYSIIAIVGFVIIIISLIEEKKNRKIFPILT